MIDEFEYVVHEAVEKISHDLLNVVYMLDITDKCQNCKYFNIDDNDTVSNNCNTYGNCIGTTLHPEIQKKIWNELK